MEELPIQATQIRQLLLEACPSFGRSAEWQEFQDDYGAEGMDLLAGAFARHLVDLHLQDRREEFGAVFDLIERLHLEGDDHVRELATVGFLEDLSNANMNHERSSPKDFERYLRPERWWWEELDLFWRGKIPLLGSSGRPRPHTSG